MVWVCPTLGRPERLRRLAISWERCAPRTPLHVRLWQYDPKKAEYYSHRWPKTWHFYESDIKELAPSMNEFALEKQPDAEVYGFIADDIVLRTPGGLELLHAMAEPCYIAYPNDRLQRHLLATHFCVGGELVRHLGWWALPGLVHSVDVPLTILGRLTGTLRFCPFVIFDHYHWAAGRAPLDATYNVMYSGETKQPDTPAYKADMTLLNEYVAPDGQVHKVAGRLLSWMYSNAEQDSDEWEAQDRADELKLSLSRNSA